jgi:hypothetical protein
MLAWSHTRRQPVPPSCQHPSCATSDFASRRLSHTTPAAVPWRPSSCLSASTAPSGGTLRVPVPSPLASGPPPSPSRAAPHASSPSPARSWHGCAPCASASLGPTSSALGRRGWRYLKLYTRGRPTPTWSHRRHAWLSRISSGLHLCWCLGGAAVRACERPLWRLGSCGFLSPLGSHRGPSLWRDACPIWLRSALIEMVWGSASRVSLI